MTEVDAIDEENADELAESFFALSSGNRLRLLQQVDEPKTRSELSSTLDISRQGVSDHLETLMEHEFVRKLQGWRESGPVEEFQIHPKPLYALGKALVDLSTLEPEGGPLGREDPDPTRAMGTQPEADEPPTGLPDAHLLILDGPDAGERFALDLEGSWTIGRDEEMDLTLDHDPYISGCQCEIQATEQGYAVVDVYSSNGTFVNFAQLPEGGRTQLSSGDVIEVGRTSLVYQTAEDRPGK